MGRTCIVGGCSAGYVENGDSRKIALLQWPVNPKVAAKWKAFVHKTRKGWHGRTTTTSVICNRHFKQECFISYYQWEMGFKKKLDIQPDAVPTIKFPGPLPHTQTECPIHISKGSDIPLLALTPESTTSLASTSSSDSNRSNLETTPDNGSIRPQRCSSCTGPTPKKPRTAALKLNIRRVSIINLHLFFYLY